VVPFFGVRFSSVIDPLLLFPFGLGFPFSLVFFSEILYPTGPKNRLCSLGSAFVLGNLSSRFHAETHSSSDRLTFPSERGKLMLLVPSGFFCLSPTFNKPLPCHSGFYRKHS